MTEVQIRCPECGNALTFVENKNNDKVMFCVWCNKLYTEAEIRERCGL